MASESKTLNRQQWLVLAAAFLGWMFDGVEMALLPLVGRPALQDLMSRPTEGELGQCYSYLMAAFLLGAATGGLAFGWLGDKIGRVRGMALSILAYSFFMGACYFAGAPWHLWVCIFCAALGMGGQWSLAVALVMECWPEKFRPMLAGVIGSACNVGILSMAVLGICFPVTTDTWRIVMAIGGAPGILAFFILGFIPESQRWRKAVEGGGVHPLREIFTTKLLKPTLLGIACASVALVGTWGAVTGFTPLWGDQLGSGDRTLSVSATVLPSWPKAFDLAEVESVDRVWVSVEGMDWFLDAKQQWGQLIAHGGIAVDGPATAAAAMPPTLKVKKSHYLSSIVLPGQSFRYRLVVSNKGRAATGETVVTEDLNPAIDPKSVTAVEPAEENSGKASAVRIDSGRQTAAITWTVGRLEPENPYAKAVIQCVGAIGAIIGCFFGPWLSRLLGRRWAYFVLCATTLVSSAILFNCIHQYNLTFILMVVVLGLFSASFYGWMPLYFPELFPTRVRATGQALCFNVGRIFAAVGVLTTGELMRFFGDKYPGQEYPKACATITLIYLAGMVIIWFCPETKGRPLPE